ncbi:type IX secretion system protein PorQ [Rufibacter sediminis]|uniref:Type IX secretion system protein PorQ n=1 Tax=Rufibacter sediminis TaxID=2762756 RepID=A0ABR6VVX9_9BACT|nr:type IX secretion system protein PorQ [Rufibacter sediminis]MBC3541319.1 type IX secretion system protein PorQ [Rufibacter sediminis]
MQKRLFLLGLLSVAFVQLAFAQVGGRSVFRFLDVPTHARVAALGGVNVSSGLEDVNAVTANPALMHGKTDNHLGLTHLNYLSDVSQNNLNYTLESSRWGRNAIGVQYLDYGSFTQTNEAGVEEGSFKVRDYAFSLSHAATIEVFTLGATAKVAVSSIAGNQAVAALIDLGGTFKHPERDFVVGLAIKNLGVMLKPYDGAEREDMPLDIQLGASYKPEHAPFRLSLTAHQLQRFDIVYLDPDKPGTINENNEEVKEKKTFGDKLARHFVVGGEFILGPGFQLRGGYNHLRRKELVVENVGGMAGFSFGASVKVHAFRFEYTYAKYHVAGASNYLTLNTDLNRFLKKKLD